MNQNEIETTIRAVIIEMRGSKILRFKEPRTNIVYQAVNDAINTLLPQEPRLLLPAPELKPKKPEKGNRPGSYERRECAGCHKKKALKQFLYNGEGQAKYCRKCRSERAQKRARRSYNEKRRRKPQEDSEPEPQPRQYLPEEQDSPEELPSSLKTIHIPINEPPSLFPGPVEFAPTEPTSQDPSTTNPKPTIKKWSLFKGGKAKD